MSCFSRPHQSDTIHTLQFSNNTTNPVKNGEKVADMQMANENRVTIISHWGNAN